EPIRPKVFGSPILATPTTRVARTSGAIMNLISLRNKSPKGSSTAIDSPKIRPNIIAITKAINICVNKLPFNNFMFSTPFILLYPLYHNILFPRRQSYIYYLTFNTKQIIKIYSYKYLFIIGVHIFAELSHSIKKGDL